MSSTHERQETQNDTGVYFPIEAKLALTIIAIGVIGLILKVTGLF
jgi:plastocyanin domain-containing protein